MPEKDRAVIAALMSASAAEKTWLDGTVVYDERDASMFALNAVSSQMLQLVRSANGSVTVRDLGASLVGPDVTSSELELLAQRLDELVDKRLIQWVEG